MRSWGDIWQKRQTNPFIHSHYKSVSLKLMRTQTFYPNDNTQDTMRFAALTNHQNASVYQMTDLFKTHNTAFGTGTLQQCRTNTLTALIDKT